MARIRTIKPAFAQSASVGRLSRDARLFFLQLLTHLDDEGRAAWVPRAILGALYPHDDDVTAGDLDRWASECERQEDMLVRYEVDGRHYICAPKFLDHQRINRPVKSLIPQFTEPSVRTHHKCSEDSLRAHAQLTEDSVKEWNGNGMEKERKVPITNDSNLGEPAENSAPVVNRQMTTREEPVEQEAERNRREIERDLLTVRKPAPTYTGAKDASQEDDRREALEREVEAMKIRQGGDVVGRMRRIQDMANAQMGVRRQAEKVVDQILATSGEVD